MSQKRKGKVIEGDNNELKIREDSGKFVCNIVEGRKVNLGDRVSFDMKWDSGKFYAMNISLLESSEDKDHPVYYFDDIEDARMGLAYILDRLRAIRENSSKFSSSEEVEDMCVEFIATIEDLMQGPEPNLDSLVDGVKELNHYSPREVPRDHPNYWLYSWDLVQFADAIEDLTSQKAKNSDFSMVWHEWKDKERQEFYHGYDREYFELSFIDKGDNSQTHVYKTPPPAYHLELTMIEQKGVAFYIGAAPVNILAQSSYVPALPPKMDIDDTAKRVLNNDFKTKEWQRQVEVKRLRKIQQFIEDSGNIIANTPMVYVNDPSAVQFASSKMTIHFDRFLKKQSSGTYAGKYIDRKKKEDRDEAGNVVFEDYRPLWLIDGQHRVKGIHRSPSNQNITVPVIIFPNDFGVSNTAKVFAEINTLQKKLDPLHELYMQHRFSIDHTSVKRKFRQYREIAFEEAANQGWQRDWLHSRANHLSYELAAKLAGQSGPLKGRIKFLPQNSTHGVYVNADQWLNYSRNWFLQHNCYQFKGEEIENYIFNPKPAERNWSILELVHKEVDAYFRALVDVCNHQGWSDIGHEGKWSENPRQVSLIQRKSHFIIILEIYNLVWRLVDDYKRSTGRPGYKSKDDFYQILSVFKWVDWRDRDLFGLYSGGGERGRRSLEAWMADALIVGDQHTYQEIHDENLEGLMSVPGAGIRCYCKSPELKVESERVWPSQSQPVVLSSMRPYNARTESKWSVYDNQDNLLLEKSISTSKYTNPQKAIMRLFLTTEMRDLDEIRVVVEWRNAHTRTGKNSVKLVKPE